jgi:hypothetical protein
MAAREQLHAAGLRVGAEEHVGVARLGPQVALQPEPRDELGRDAARGVAHAGGARRADQADRQVRQDEVDEPAERGVGRVAGTALACPWGVTSGL